MVLYEIVLNRLLMFKIMDSIVEILASVIAFYCVYRLHRRYSEKKTKPTLYLILLFTVLGICPLMQFMDGLFYTGWGTENSFLLYDIQYGYAGIIITTSIANITLLYFATEIFVIKEDGVARKTQILRLIMTIAILAIAVIGGLMKINDLDVTIVIGLYMVLAIFLNLFLGINAMKLASKIEDPTYRNSIRSIGYFAFSLLGIYVFFILDSFYDTYSIWGFFGWSLFLIATYLGYLGFVKPIGYTSKNK